MTSFLDDPGGFANERRRRAVDDMPRCTIVVVGKTGVGKSTFINGVFGERLAETAWADRSRSTSTSTAFPACR